MKGLWEPDLSSMREPVWFSKIYLYKFELVLITGSHSCENLRSVFSSVLTQKSVNPFSLWEPGWKPSTGWEPSLVTTSVGQVHSGGLERLVSVLISKKQTGTGSDFLEAALELELDFYFLKNWIQNKILWLHLRVELELELKPRIWKKKTKKERRLTCN